MFAGCASTKQAEDTIARLQKENARLREQVQQQVPPQPTPVDQFDRGLSAQMLNELQQEKARLERELAALQKDLSRLEGEKARLERRNRDLQKATEAAIRKLNRRITELEDQVYLLQPETD
jgi:hypothetical protein